MTLSSSYKIISSDDHIIEPGDLWTSRVETKFRDRAPRIVRLESGDDWWVCEGVKIGGIGSGTQAGRRFEEPEKLRIADNVENARPGGYIAEERVKDMDIDGVDVSILYPTTGLQFYSIPDSEFVTVPLQRPITTGLPSTASPFPTG